MKLRYLSDRQVPLAFACDPHPAILFAMEQVWIVWTTYMDTHPVITGGQEGAHSENSLHFGKYPDPRARAIDVAHDYNVEETSRVVIIKALRRRLGIQFDVVWEPRHVHIEYDPGI